MYSAYGARLRSVATITAVIAAVSLGACGKSTTSAPAAAPPPVHFVNSQADAKSPDLAAHYVDFSFDYPSTWKVDPATGSPTAANFVKVSRDNADGITIENFAVGEFAGTGDPERDAPQIPGLLEQIEGQVSNMAGYKRLGIGQPTTINGLAGQQLTFSATPQIGGKPGNLFGRIVIVPQPGTAKGVLLIMLGTDASGEIHSIADLGVKGQLPTILNSFKFGPAAPASDESNAAASDESDNATD